TRHEQHAAAHSEHAGHDSAGHADCDRADHRSTSSTALATSTAANSSEIERFGTRCCSHVPSRTPPPAGTPTSTASSTCTLPYRPCVAAAKPAMKTIAASDVAVA